MMDIISRLQARLGVTEIWQFAKGGTQLLPRVTLAADERETVQMELDNAEERITAALAAGDTTLEVGGLMDVDEAQALVKAWRIALGKEGRMSDTKIRTAEVGETLTITYAPLYPDAPPPKPRPKPVRVTRPFEPGKPIPFDTPGMIINAWIDPVRRIISYDWVPEEG